jgi:hypothetical protein
VSAPDYLWPARPEYVRDIVRGAVRYTDYDHTLCFVLRGDDPKMVMTIGADDDRRPMKLTDACIDLRDVTARAHAAMAWTEVGADGRVYLRPDLRARMIGVSEQGQAVLIETLLRRMRAMDPRVGAMDAAGVLAAVERAAGVAP